MSPTVDETATTRDARIAEHGKRQQFLRGVMAAGLEGMPMPMTVAFTGGAVTLRMDSDAPSDVDDWATFLGATTETDPHVHAEGGPGPWQSHATSGAEWRGYRLRVWCLVRVEADAS